MSAKNEPNAVSVSIANLVESLLICAHDAKRDGMTGTEILDAFSMSSGVLISKATRTEDEIAKAMSRCMHVQYESVAAVLTGKPDPTQAH